MRTLIQLLVAVFLLLGSSRLLFAQDEFYNRDSSGYTYRIGPVLPRIQQDWQLGTLGRDFTFGFNPSGVNIENYVLSLLNLPDITTALQASTATDVFNYLLLQSFQSPTEASVLSNATSMMNQKLTIRMLQDVLRRLQLGPDPAASIQAGAQEKCVQLAASFGLLSVESAEKICSGGLGGAARGIMIFGTPSTTDKIVSGSTMSGEDKQLAKDLIIDFRTDPLSSLRQDVYRVMPVKSVSDVRQELEDAICEEVRARVRSGRIRYPCWRAAQHRRDYSSHGGSAFRSRKDGAFHERGQYSEHLPETIPGCHPSQDHAASPEIRPGA